MTSLSEISEINMTPLMDLTFILLITFINPAYIGELPTTGLGQGLIVFGVIAWVLAVFWMRRIIRLVF